MKLLCYGYLNKTSGSVLGANFFMLEELLKRGHDIYWMYKESDSPLHDLCQYDNFHLISVPDPSFYRARLGSLCPGPLKKLFNRTVAPLMQNLYSHGRDQRLMKRVATANHETEAFDLLLFLGLYGTFRVPGLPVVSWAQGAPYTEWFYIRKLRRKIVALCGWLTYLQFKYFYMVKHSRVKGELACSDVVICGSQWSKEQLQLTGVLPEQVRKLPYPMDLDAFQIAEPSTSSSGLKKTFLWLGRIDPRKRLDLLLEAYRLLLDERQDVHLHIVGGFRHTPGYRKLLDDFEYPEAVSYAAQVERHLIPALIASSDVLIQPSEGENFGSSPAEALCCGVPVILGPTNGTKDYTGDASTFLFEEYTAESLKDSMVEALEQLEHSRESIALAARKTAEENFSMSTIVDELEKILLDTAKLNSRATQIQQPVECIAS